jgi:DNA-directed RNA polymerase specialized sigma24 family protein
MKPRSMTAIQFEALLERLSPDREQAGQRYEFLRRRLISLFMYRGCATPEELADETLDRVARKIAEMPASFEGKDPSPLVFGIAWNVARESFHTKRPAVLPDGCDPVDPSPPADEQGRQEREQRCLDLCLHQLPVVDRTLVLAYFEKEKRAKIEQRSLLAAELRITPNALRLRVHRVTAALRDCVYDCADESGRGTQDALSP